MSLNPHVCLYKPLSMYEPHVVSIPLCVLSLLPLCVSIPHVYVSDIPCLCIYPIFISHAPHCFCLIPPHLCLNPLSLPNSPCAVSVYMPPVCVYTPCLCLYPLFMFIPSRLCLCPFLYPLSMSLPPVYVYSAPN